MANIKVAWQFANSSEEPSFFDNENISIQTIRVQSKNDNPSSDESISLDDPCINYKRKKIVKKLNEIESSYYSQSYEDAIKSIDSLNSFVILINKNYLIKELKELMEQCAKNNWGGENENQLKDESYNDLLNFINNLGSTFPHPEIVPEPSGNIGLEWRNKKSGFLVSFKGEKVILYAGVFSKKDRVNGITNCSSAFNKFLIEYLKKVFPILG